MGITYLKVIQNNITFIYTLCLTTIMYDGRTGLKTFQAHVERLKSDGKDPWIFFMLDYAFILKYFGQEAADWAMAKRELDLQDFLSRTEEIKTISDAKELGTAQDVIVAAGGVVVDAPV